MAEVELKPKKRFQSNREKDNIIVSSETWEQMKANGMARNFTVVNRQPEKDNELTDKIKNFTKEINAVPQPNYQELMAEYRKNKANKEKAYEILLRAEKSFPENAFIKKELKKFE